MKTLFKFLLFLFLLLAAAVAGYFLLDKGETRDIVSFVPDDFIYAIESDKPLRDWQELSGSEMWQFLKGNDFFAEMTTSADYLDSLLTNNPTIAKLIKLGDLMVSAHMLDAKRYDFVIMVDLRGLKFGKLQTFITPFISNFDYQVSRSSYFNIDIVNLYDPNDRSTLSVSIVDNILVCSYDEDLVKKAIAQTEKPSIVENEDFALIRNNINRNQLYSLYVNYNTLDDWVKSYTNELPEMMKGLDKIVSFSSFDFGIGEDRAELNGYLKPIDSVTSFLTVFKEVGKGKVLAQEVLPNTTAMFVSIGFDDFDDFFERYLAYLQDSDPLAFEEIMKNQERVEKHLDISLQEDFFSWMTEEIVLAVIPRNESQSSYAHYAMLHFDSFEKAKGKLDGMTDKLKSKAISPVKFKTIDYRGFEIKYLEMKGFFKLFFKKLFSQIEKPHYTYLDDYVIFSTDTTDLKLVIDKYLNTEVLKQDEDYKRFRKNFESKSNIFTYIDNAYFYDYMRSSMDPASRRELDENRKLILGFPQIGFQLYPGGGMYESYLYSEFKPEQKN